MGEDSRAFNVKPRRNSYPRSSQSTEGSILRRQSAPPLPEVQTSTQSIFPPSRGTLNRVLTPPLGSCRPRQEIGNAQSVMERNLTPPPRPDREQIRDAEKQYVSTRNEKPEDWVRMFSSIRSLF